MLKCVSWCISAALHRASKKRQLKASVLRKKIASKTNTGRGHVPQGNTCYHLFQQHPDLQSTEGFWAKLKVQ
eukprot:5685406-Amphidinium_carterae.1